MKSLNDAFEYFFLHIQSQALRFSVLRLLTFSKPRVKMSQPTFPTWRMHSAHTPAGNYVAAEQFSKNSLIFAKSSSQGWEAPGRGNFWKSSLTSESLSLRSRASHQQHPPRQSLLSQHLSPRYVLTQGLGAGVSLQLLDPACKYQSNPGAERKGSDQPSSCNSALSVPLQGESDTNRYSHSFICKGHSMKSCISMYFKTWKTHVSSWYVC